MRYLFVAAAKDIRRRLADPAAFAVWIGLPLLLGGLLSFINADDGAPPRATVLVVDEDGTFSSRLLLTALERAPTMELQTVSLDEGRRRIDDGDATALLVVSKGFEQAVLGASSGSSGSPSEAELTLVTNPAQQILPNIVEETLEIVVEGVFYAQQIFGSTLRRLADSAGPGRPSDVDVAAMAIEINREVTSLQNVLFPPAIALTVARAAPEQAAPSLSLGQLFLPGMLFMSLLFIAGGMAGDIWEEQQMGTLKRAIVPESTAYATVTESVLAGNQLQVTFERRGDDLAATLDEVRLNRAIYTVVADLAAIKANALEVTPAAFDTIAAAPRRVTLAVRAAGARPESPPVGFAQAVPGTMVMFTMVILLTSGAVMLVVEREHGLLRRLASAPVLPGSTMCQRSSTSLGAALPRSSSTSNSSRPRPRTCPSPTPRSTSPSRRWSCAECPTRWPRSPSSGAC